MLIGIDPISLTTIVVEASPRSDVIHARARVACFALDHIGDRRLLQDVTSCLGRLAEHPLGVATERTVEQLDDFEHGYLGGVARKAVAALDPPLRADQARTAQNGEELLQELNRHISPVRELAD